MKERVVNSMGNIGFTEFLLIAVVALIIFGPAKLPELGRALGRTIREFKQGARELVDMDEPKPERKDVTPPPQAAEEPAMKEAAQVRPEQQNHASSGEASAPNPVQTPTAKADSRRLPD